mmetsp:Transcript_11344/g.28999  ORF Transcript_11344/g.28999 Transcript_11344/m.28999 type:complete len:623 (+) Transcript_11344:6-1874(+)
MRLAVCARRCMLPHPCTRGWPAAFNASLDFVSLHYDCSADPDDFESMVADRLVLESTWGTEWLKKHVIAVGGTYGTNLNYQRIACEKVLQATWGDVGAAVRAGVGQNEARQEHAQVRAAAVQLAFAQYSAVLSRGGRIYVKEGGQSDFTFGVLNEIEVWQPGAARCVHVVQHAHWNEQTTSPGILQRMSRGMVGSYTKIGDGNRELQRRNWALAGSFVKAARASWLGCAWELALAEFAKLPSYCFGSPPRKLGVDRCIDFSDTMELLHILRLPRLTMEEFYDRFLAEYFPMPPSSSPPSLPPPLEPPPGPRHPTPSAAPVLPLTPTPIELRPPGQPPTPDTPLRHPPPPPFKPSSVTPPTHPPPFPVNPLPRAPPTPSMPPSEPPFAPAPIMPPAGPPSVPEPPGHPPALPIPQPPQSPALQCFSWCEYSAGRWEIKCKWYRCNGCDPCLPKDRLLQEDGATAIDPATFPTPLLPIDCAVPTELFPPTPLLPAFPTPSAPTSRPPVSPSPPSAPPPCPQLPPPVSPLSPTAPRPSPPRPMSSPPPISPPLMPPSMLAVPRLSPASTSYAIRFQAGLRDGMTMGGTLGLMVGFLCVAVMTWKQAKRPRGFATLSPDKDDDVST